MKDAKSKKSARGSAEPLRARGKQTTKPASKDKSRGSQGKRETKRDQLPPPDPPRVEIKNKGGRPPNTPDLWTPEYIAAVAEDMRQYTADTDFPTEAEFCYTRQIHFQRLSEFPELREAKEMLFAKRQAQTIKRGLSLQQGDGPLGSFLAKLSANAGPYSLTDKSEVGLAHSGSIDTVAMSPEEREARIKEILSKAGK